MSLGTTFSRLLLKQLVDDVDRGGGVEAVDAVVDFLTRCGKQQDPRLTAALESAMHRAWRALETAFRGEPSSDHCQAGLAPREAQKLRQCLERVLAELAHGGARGGQASVRVVAHGLRRQCLEDLRSARAGETLSGCLDLDEWALSREVLHPFTVEQGRRDTRRRTEGQLLRELEQQGCVGLVRLLTAGAALPLLVMAARAFLCQELEHLLYHCLQHHPEQTPDNCTVVLDLLHELSRPHFSVWRSPVLPPQPFHWSRLESGSDRRSPSRLPRRGASKRSARRRPDRNLSWDRLLPQQSPAPSPSKRGTGPTPKGPWVTASVLALLVILLVVLPCWLLVADARQHEREQQQIASERQRLREERRRIEEEHRQWMDTQRRLAQQERERQHELQRQREDAERRQRMEVEEQQRQAEELADRRRAEKRRRQAEQQEALRREKQQRLERARRALEKGWKHAAYGQDREALAAFNEALELDPHLDHGWSARGRVRRRLGDLAGALKDFQEAVRRDPKDVRSWFQCGELHRQRRDHQQAIDAFSRIVELEPANAEAYRQRGLCYAGKGNVEQALADQTRAIELAPDDPRAYAHRGDLHRLRGRHDPAFADYTTAIDRTGGVDRGLSAAYRGRGLLSLQGRDYRQAVRDLTHALDQEPDDIAARGARGLAYVCLGEYNDALFDAQELIEHDADDSAAYKLRGQAYLGLREYRKAHDDFTRALRKRRDAETFYLRAWARANMGDINEAIFDCNDATALDPRLSKAFALRARLYLSDGYRPRALTHPRAARAMDLLPGTP